MNQLARGPQEAIDWIGQIAGHLFHPLAVGLRVDPGDVTPAGLQLDHEEDEIPPKTGQCEHLDREEIGGRQAFPVRLQERLPRRALVPLGSRYDPVVVQDPLDRVPGDVVAEVGERAADPRVAPRRILPRHPYDEFGHRPGRHRPSPTPAGTAIVLLGDQPPVPAENRVGRDDACHLTQDPPAEFLASHRESPALGVGQAKRSRTKMLPEDAILLPEIVDAIFLVASYPASQGQHEEVQSVGHGRRLHGSDTAVTHVVSGIHSPRPFSCTIRGRGVPAVAPGPRQSVAVSLQTSPRRMDDQQERRHSRPCTCCRLTFFTLRHRTLPAVAGASSAHDHAVILFDGTCAFCEGAVKFIARRDPAGYFKYGASQSPTAAALLAPHGIDRETARSIVLIEAGQIYLRSTASLRIARRLPFPWSLAGALLVVPRPLRDAVYRVVAAVRQRLAGSSNACEVPPPEIRQRLV